MSCWRWPDMVFRQAKWDEKLLFELGRTGRIGYVPPDPIDGDVELKIPNYLERKEIDLPSLTEMQVVRHFVRLSQMNFSVDTGMYPLGSCTRNIIPSSMTGWLHLRRSSSPTHCNITPPFRVCFRFSTTFQCFLQRSQVWMRSAFNLQLVLRANLLAL